MVTRSARYILQVRRSLLLKVLSIGLSFYSVRINIQYLGVEQYGVWAVIFSIMTLLVFFDFGVSNGLKNKVSESLIRSDYSSARTYIASAYVFSLGLFFTLISIFYVFCGYFDWTILFDSIHTDQELDIVFLVAASFVLLNFILMVVHQVINAVQKSSITVFSQLLTLILMVLSVSLLSLYSEGKLIYISVAYGLSIVTSNFVITVYFYKGHRELIPKLGRIERDKFLSLCELGGKFFLLQIFALVISLTDRILVSKFVGVSEVSIYDVLYKYFSILIVFHTLINAPLWSIYSEAYGRKDYLWIRSMVSKFGVLFCAYFTAVLFMSIFGPLVVKYWIGEGLGDISRIDILFIGIMALFYMAYTSLAMLSNGINYTYPQMLLGGIGALLNIPMSAYLSSFLGMKGIVLASIISYSFFVFGGPITLMKKLK